MAVRDSVKKLFTAREQYSWLGQVARPHLKGLFFLIGIDAITTYISLQLIEVNKNVIDIANGRLNAPLVWAIVSMAVFNLINLGFGVINSMFRVTVAEKINFKIRQRVFAKLLNANWLSVTAYHSGDLQTRLTSDVNAVASSVSSVFPSMVSLIITFIMALVMLVQYDAMLALFILILAPVSVVTVRILGRRLKVIQRKVQESESRYRAFTQENLANLAVVKSFSFQEHSVEKLEELHKNRLLWIIKRNRLSVLASSVLSIAHMSSYTVAMAWGASRALAGQITLGTVTAFIQLVQKVQGPIIGLAQTIPSIVSVLASAERLMELESIQPEKQGEALPASSQVTLTLDNVGFSYREGEPVLRECDMRLHPGDVAALTGLSGVGKTTLVRVLLMLIEPDHGMLTMENNEGRSNEISAALREQIAYVPQGNTLFSGTIAENLRMGKFDATEEEMVEALQAADAMTFVSKLPDGLETIIGERAGGLSEGQAQRIAIARALIRNAPLLILDEATSSLDEETECTVLDRLHARNARSTCLVITHRSSALRYCNRRFEMHNGILKETPMPPRA